MKNELTLMAVLSPRSEKCEGCLFIDNDLCDFIVDKIKCDSEFREDGKSIIWVLKNDL